MTKAAKFNLGDIVIHSKQGYRAIIVDIDPLFQASGRYNPQSCKREFATKNPWYRLLVDKTSQETYVEECYLIKDCQVKRIENPGIHQYLKKRKGQYCSRLPLH
ncbi:heat shock protein HspQ [Legionella israelensis]|uniref:Heat shock protein HspQ n=1 Tax=Legionella israelensis TaxID=454 RepID=A0AAX1EIZ5_9GAMM|nr:heat shock protein HspQ [Legionella israelensis]QBR85121.1 heat shock protein HspQ [Legionella israelensis]